MALQLESWVDLPMILLIPLAFFFSTLSFANSQSIEATGSQDLVFNFSNELKSELDQLRKIGPEEFPTKIETIRNTMILFIQVKARVCSGEFTTAVLEDTLNVPGPKSSGPPLTKLSKEQKQLCYGELKAFQTTYINYLFEARKRYLDYLHNQRLGELFKTRDKILQDLQKGVHVF